MKNGEVIELYEGLEKLSQSTDVKFKTKVAYAIAKNREKARAEAAIIEKLRQDIINDYGVIEPNGDITIAKDKLSLVNSDIQELMDLESEIKIRKISLEDLGELELSVEDMKGLSKMIEDLEDEEDEVISLNSLGDAQKVVEDMSEEENENEEAQEE